MSIEKLRANEIIGRMCMAAEVKNTVKLAEFLGYRSTGTISGWKKTGVVPDSVLAKISEKTRCSFEWLKNGRGGLGQGDEHRVKEASVHYGPTLNRDVLDKAIERTEFILEKTDRTLNPTQKATFISTLYEMAMEQGESALDETNVTRLIRLVG